MSVFTRLRKIQKTISDSTYPGTPHTEAFVICLQNDKVYSMWEKNPYDIKRFANDLQSSAFYYGIDANGLTKGSFIIDSKMPNYNEIKEMNNEDFYIDSYDFIKFTLSIFSAIREYKGENAYIFAYFYGDGEYFDIQVFKDNEEEKVKQYKEDYFAD